MFEWMKKTLGLLNIIWNQWKTTTIMAQISNLFEI